MLCITRPDLDGNVINITQDDDSLKELKETEKINPFELKMDISAQKCLNKSPHLFSFPDCPLYEKTIRLLLEKIFKAEMILGRWKDPRNKDPSLDLLALPLNPYKNLLADLMAIRFISSHRVPEKLNYSKLAVLNYVPLNLLDSRT